MAYTLSQQIGDSGEDKFRDLLPFGWLKHKRDPDHHTDFVVERVVDNELTGEKILVQVKTVQRTPSGKLAAKTEVSTLKFAKRSRVPVFVVLIDLQTETGRFQFLTEYADQIENSSKVWNQNFRKVRISSDNDIHDPDIFGLAIEEAWKYMSEKFPGSIASAATIAANDLMAQDDRFLVTPTFDGKTTTFVCSPSQKDVEFNIVFKAESDSAKDRVREFIKAGGRIDPAEDLQVIIRDGPGGLGRDVSCGITMTSQTPGSIKWKILESGGRRLASQVFPVTWRGGESIRKANFGLSCKDIFSGEHTVVIDRENLRCQSTFTITLDITKWDGCLINSLGGYDEIESLFAGSQNAKKLQITTISNGVPVSGVIELPEFHPIKDIGATIGVVKKLRQIQNITGSEIYWNNAKIDKAWAEINSVYDSLCGQGLELTFNNIRMRIIPSEMKDWSKKIKEANTFQIVREIEIELFGNKIAKVSECVVFSNCEGISVGLDESNEMVFEIEKADAVRQYKMVK